uniref:Glutamine amidotransferase domain-containing protein n=2 Tax=Paramoeba aestuarina TaxID=180227 RepID=A0A7S4UD93_9EUKA|mmetsp:Transcript_8584/g.13018  ORF Transcript_8584/g.13018 Transcript_8584/m.13018 type:complete len:258 (+) Transcript_8584:280-1053(+)
MLERVSPLRSETDIIYPADPDFVNPSPAELQKYHGVAWTGSSLTVHHHEDERVQSQLRLARSICEKRIPSFGSCWAVQIAAVALGGVVAKCPLMGREQGICRKIQLTDIGRSHPMMEGKPSVFDAFGAHDDEVTHLPPTGLNLATNSHSMVQATSAMVGFAEFWAVQYHPEYDLHELARLTSARIEKFIRLGFFKTPEDAKEYISHLDTIHADPTRKDLMWRYGLDKDVLSEDVRLVEVRNWVKKLVVPYRREGLGL